MTWWALLIFGVTTSIATGVIVWLVVRRAVGSVDRSALDDSLRRYQRDKLAAETERSEQLERAAEELRKRLAINREWYLRKLEERNEEIDEEFDALVRDDDALLARLSHLFRGSAAEDPEGEGEGVEEGGEDGDRGDPTDPEGVSGDVEGVGEAGGGSRD